MLREGRDAENGGRLPEATPVEWMLCLERSRLLAQFAVAVRAYHEATFRWQTCAQSDDLSDYREADAAKQMAHIDYEIARLELEKHTVPHGCEPEN